MICTKEMKQLRKLGQQMAWRCLIKGHPLLALKVLKGAQTDVRVVLDRVLADLQLEENETPQLVLVK